MKASSRAPQSEHSGQKIAKMLKILPLNAVVIKIKHQEWANSETGGYFYSLKEFWFEKPTEDNFAICYRVIIVDLDSNKNEVKRRIQKDNGVVGTMPSKEGIIRLGRSTLKHQLGPNHELLFLSPILQKEISE